MLKDTAQLFDELVHSPSGQELDFEAEEAGILEATARLPVQLVVEESGCPDFLKDRLSQEGRKRPSRPYGKTDPGSQGRAEVGPHERRTELTVALTPVFPYQKS